MAGGDISVENGKKRKENRHYSILFGGVVGGIIALALCSCLLLGNYFLTANSFEPPPEPPFLIFFIIFVLMTISGAYIANKRHARKMSAGTAAASAEKTEPTASGEKTESATSAEKTELPSSEEKS